MPTSSNAAISREVATGRRMNGVEMLMGAIRLFWALLPGWMARRWLARH